MLIIILLAEAISEPFLIVIFEPLIVISPVLPAKPKDVGVAAVSVELVGSVVNPKLTPPKFTAFALPI